MKYLIGAPHITEKAMSHVRAGWYTFRVRKEASKHEAASEIEKLYKVNVIDVRTIAMHGKKRRAGKKQVTRELSDWKKVLVRLKAGQTIAAFETQGEQKSS